MTQATRTAEALDDIISPSQDGIGYGDFPFTPDEPEGDPLDTPAEEEPFRRKLLRYKLRIVRHMLSRASNGLSLEEIANGDRGAVLVVLPKQWVENYEPSILWLLRPGNTFEDLKRLVADGRYYSSPRLISDDEDTVERIVSTIEKAQNGGLVAVQVHRGTIDEIPSYVRGIFQHQLVLSQMTGEVLNHLVQDLLDVGLPKSLAWPDLKYVSPDHVAMAAAISKDVEQFLDFLRAAGEKGEKQFLELERERPGSRRKGTEAPKPIRPSLRLEKLRGMDEARSWAEDLIEDLSAYKAGDLAWSQVDRGALIHGQPGVGKTIFAQALAGSAGLPLVLGSVMRWQSAGTGHLGDCLQAMRACFQQATEHAPCILFIDEIDSFLSRDSLVGNGHEYWRQVTNALLELLDGVEGREGVVVIGACNNPDKVDPAIVRSGRLDRSIEIPLPDTDALNGILRHHLGGELADTELASIARMSQGATGADVERWVRGARRRARKEKRILSIEDLRAEAGPDLPDYLLKEREITAVHEIGHAILYEQAWPGIVEEVRLLDRPVEGAWGWTKLKFDVPMTTREDVRKQLICLLGGRAAELLVFGETMFGSSLSKRSDIGRATMLAVLGAIEFDETHEHLYLAYEPSEMINKVLSNNNRLRAIVQAEMSCALDEAKNVLGGQSSTIQKLTDELSKSGCLKVRRLLKAEETR